MLFFRLIRHWKKSVWCSSYVARFHQRLSILRKDNLWWPFSHYQRKRCQESVSQKHMLSVVKNNHHPMLVSQKKHPLLLAVSLSVHQTHGNKLFTPVMHRNRQEGTHGCRQRREKKPSRAEFWSQRRAMKITAAQKNRKKRWEESGPETFHHSCRVDR